ncbi:DUF975 family protein [Streptococcus sp. DD13]|uniref:DUF975 family protein n=1 Tax=Streptococcus sp. DD13 TaxID=1777881 RepID=UPI00079AB94D|nr:DUF975 family protein [Streptococcus sp. DD13]KXT79314.1 membrane protein [Streptococcus sp. DD13]
MSSIRELKEKAREKNAQYPRVMRLTTLPVALAFVLSLLSSVSNNRTSWLEELSTGHVPIGQTLSVVLFPLSISILTGFINWSITYTIFKQESFKEEDLQGKDALRLFWHPRFNKVFTTYFLRDMLLILYSLPLLLGFGLNLKATALTYAYSDALGMIPVDQIPLDTQHLILFLNLAGLLFFLLGCFLLIFAILTYSQVDFLLFEHLDEKEPIKSWKLLQASRLVMKGRRWFYFKLEWSFFPWILLQSLSFGIVGIYLIPYQEWTRYLFYQMIRKESVQPSPKQTES